MSGWQMISMIISPLTACHLPMPCFPEMPCAVWVMASFNCQPDTTYRHSVRDCLYQVGLSVGNCLKLINKDDSAPCRQYQPLSRASWTAAQCRQHHPLSRASWTKYEWREGCVQVSIMTPFLSARNCRHDVTTCMKFLPWFPHNDGLQLWGEINLTLPKKNPIRVFLTVTGMKPEQQAELMDTAWLIGNGLPNPCSPSMATPALYCANCCTFTRCLDAVGEILNFNFSRDTYII